MHPIAELLSPAAASAAAQTSIGMGGCSLAATQGNDATFVLLLVLSVIYLSFGKFGTLRTLKSGISIFLSTTLAAGPTLADVNHGLYLGIGAGMSRLVPLVENAELTERDDKGFAGSGFLGYEINRKASFEFSYSDLGTATLEPVGSIDYQDMNISGLYHFGGAATLRSTKPYSFFGRLGVGTIRNQSNLQVERSNDYHWLAGAGVQVPLTSKFLLRAEGTNYDSDVSSLGLSLVYRFVKPSQHKNPLFVKAPAEATSASNDTEINESITSTKNQIKSNLHDQANSNVGPGLNIPPYQTLSTDTGNSSNDIEPLISLDDGNSTPTGESTPVTELADEMLSTSPQTVSSASESSIDTRSVQLASILTTPATSSVQVMGKSTAVDAAMDDKALLNHELILASNHTAAATISAPEASSPSNDMIPEALGAFPASTEIDDNYAIPSPVQFNFDSSKLSNSASSQLEPLAQHMMENPELSVTLIGHTDSIGPEQYNQLLSEHRAETIRKYLLQMGIDRKMIKVRGAGEKRPIRSNKNAAGRKANRRVEIAFA
ncbi:MAG: OmpA family protein [Granulosicoccus sp.]|nr:OmpA family protein [Granulosicoccus sp.]